MQCFVKASTSNACVGEYSKQEAKLKDIKAFGRHYTKRKATNPKHGNPKSGRIIHPNPNLKGIA